MTTATATKPISSTLGWLPLSLSVQGWCHEHGISHRIVLWCTDDGTFTIEIFHPGSPRAYYVVLSPLDPHEKVIARLDMALSNLDACLFYRVSRLERARSMGLGRMIVGVVMATLMIWSGLVFVGGIGWLAWSLIQRLLGA